MRGIKEDNDSRTYLALGDSMSIDEYTGVKGGDAILLYNSDEDPTLTHNTRI